MSSGEPLASPTTRPHRRCFDTARLRLARVAIAPTRHFSAVLNDVCEIVAGAFEIGRVSIWRFIDDGRAIRNDHLYQPSSPSASAGCVLYARDFPQYFRALSGRSVIAIRDVENDPIRAEFREPYLMPLGIRAMLDAPIYVDRQMVGIICHEQLDTPRTWRKEDLYFATSAAETIARLFQEAARFEAEGICEAYRLRIRELERAANLGRLAASIAHDFGNVLTAVFGYAHVLNDVATNVPEVPAIVQGLCSSAERGQALTRDLTLLGRAENDRPAVTDVAALLEAELDFWRATAGPRHEVVLTKAKSIGRIFIDSTLLKRALGNLILNARDAMPEGGRIEVLAGERRSDRHHDGEAVAHVVIEIVDHGCGIDAATRERLFEPFFTTKGRQGTGLGMFIVHQVVVMAGGTIDVDSIQGRGTTIRILLPRIGGAVR